MLKGPVSMILSIVSIAAWVTHLYTAYQIQAWMWLLGGFFFPPAGILNGILIWIGRSMM